MSLTRIVQWSHQLVCEVLQPGDLAVDLTAGKGRDTLALARAVDLSGQVVAFDLQPDAVQQTSTFLAENGLSAVLHDVSEPLSGLPGIYLVCSCHSQLARLLRCPAKAIIANLGYLPGGDQILITRPETTLLALQQSLDLLAPGGRLAVTIYPSHPGGAEEAQAVDHFFAALPSDTWQVLLVRAANRPEAPYLYVAERAKQHK